MLLCDNKVGLTIRDNELAFILVKRHSTVSTGSVIASWVYLTF